MTKLRAVALLLACVALSLTALVASARPLPPKVKQTSSPIAALAMDGSRVVYAAGGRISVWNIETGTTSVVKGSYSKYPAEVAIAGTRVAWISRFVIGNTYQTTERLYTAQAGGTARLLRMGRRYQSEEPDKWRGAWIAGAVGGHDVLVVSTWWTNGRTITGDGMQLITPNRLRAISGGIVSQAVGNGVIAVLRFQGAWTTSADRSTVPGIPWVGLFSTKGKLLRNFAPSSAKEIALAGGRLVVLTGTKTLEVFSTTTGELLHTWPVAVGTPRLQPGHLAAYGNLATYSVDPRYSTSRSVHVLSLTTGKDVVVGTGRSGAPYYYGRDAALGPRGLVYSVTFHERGKLGTPQRGKLVLVPTVKLLAAFAGRHALAATSTQPRTLVAAPRQITAFAQSSQALAWTSSDGRVRMKRLPTGKSTVVGRIDSQERAFGSWLAISGTRVVWAWDSGGNSNATSIVSGGLGLKQGPVTYLNGGGPNVGDGQRFSGLGGDSSTLAFGWVDERCNLPFGICELCEPLDSCSLVVAGGGVSIVTATAKPPTLPGITPPALFALAEGRVALAQPGRRHPSAARCRASSRTGRSRCSTSRAGISRPFRCWASSETSP